MAATAKKRAEKNGSPSDELPQSDTNGNAEEPTNGEAKRRPAYSVKCHSDRTTKIEAAVWPYETTLADGTTLTRYGIVLARSYKDQQGTWHNPEKDGQGRALNSMFSAHDVPVILFLLEKCHNWCLEQRITVS